MKLSLALLFMAFLGCSLADDIPLQANFTLNRYLGRWFENYRTKNIRFESGTDIQAIYTLNSEDGTVNVTNKQYFPDRQEWDSIQGVAKVDNPEEPARLSVKFYWWQPAGDYRVLWTDYEQISVVYSEMNILGVYKVKSAWILGRKQNLTDSLIDQGFRVLKERTGLEREEFLKTPTGQAPSLDD
jgi:apolipoprotein D and lipocalin family protein